MEIKPKIEPMHKLNQALHQYRNMDENIIKSAHEANQDQKKVVSEWEARMRYNATCLVSRPKTFKEKICKKLKLK